MIGSPREFCVYQTAHLAQSRVVRRSIGTIAFLVCTCMQLAICLGITRAGVAVVDVAATLASLSWTKVWIVLLGGRREWPRTSCKAMRRGERLAQTSATTQSARSHSVQRDSLHIM